MNEPKHVAKAVFFIEGDENALEYQAHVIEHEGVLWLVATWLVENATGTRYPDRIVPMDNLPHVVQADGLIRLGMLMPRLLLAQNAPPELLHEYGASAYPSLAHIRGPSSTH